MAKQLNVNLAFTADTAKAKAQLNDLQNQLTKLNQLSFNNKGLSGLDGELQRSISLAGQLKMQLEAATNQDTGKLDLTKFSDSMKKAKLNVQDYQKALANLGPEGDKAFMALSRSIAMAEVPLRRTNALLAEFATTLKNTARWQISSSMLHGFMGALQSAYGYAKDLNESLNNIRIVTGQSTEQMAEFAQQANAAAKSLSTTTLAYTDASLIFYQQGLDNVEVKERTDAVIKMANVTKDAETEVSSYMTAIWNNFAGEKKELEEYADVITALGAATASSSAEIAGGLEQFAAVGQQIGLSYDYAATALATVVAQTRQSENVVGTAFKTIFARMQGLSQDEEQEDGTDYNKYSKALLAVGVDIKEVNGELKDMDTILDELAGQWGNLSDQERVALAQTVAGTRQYTQFMALMNAFQGKFYENLDIAKNSQGALNEQQKRYAEGWEAAAKRTKAAWEGVYGQLLDDKFFISLTNGFGKIADGIGGMIKGLGGLPGVLTLIGGLLVKTFNADLIKTIDNIGFGFKSLVGINTKEAHDTKSSFATAAQNMERDSANPGAEQAGAVYKEQGKTQELLIANSKRLTEEDQAQLGLLMDIQDRIGQQTIELAKQAEILSIKNTNYQNEQAGWYEEVEGYQSLSQAMRDSVKEHTQLLNAKKLLQRISESDVKDTEKLKAAITKVCKAYNIEIKDIDKVVHKMQVEKKSLNEILKIEDKIKKKEREVIASKKALSKAIAESAGGNAEAKKQVDQMAQSEREAAQAAEEAANSQDQFAAATDEVNSAIKGAHGGMEGLAQRFTAATQGAMAIGTAISSISSLFDIFNDKTKSTGEKLVSLFTALPMVLVSAVSAFKSLNTAFGITQKFMSQYQQAQVALIKSKAEEASITGTLATVETLATLSKMEGSKVATEAVAELGLENTLKALNITVTEGMTVAQLKSIIVTKTLTAALRGLWTTLWPIGLVLLAIAGVAAVVTAVLNAQAKETANAAEAADTLAANSREEAKAAEEQKRKADELAKSYDALAEKYENNEIELKDLQTETYKLLESYGLHDEAVKALSGSYEDLSESIAAAQRAANDEAIKAAQKDMNNQTSAMAARMVADEDGSVIDDHGTTIDLVGTNGKNSAGQNNLIAELEKMGIDVGDGSGHINLNDFVNQAVTNRDELLELLQTYQNANNSVSDGDAAETANQLLEFLDTYKSYADNYEASQALLNEAQLDNVGLDNYTRGAIQSVEDLESTIQTMTEQAKQYFGDDEAAAERWARSYLSAYDDVAAIIEQSDAQESLSDRILGNASDIKDFINQVAQEDGLDVLRGLQINEQATLENVQAAYYAAQAQIDEEHLVVTMDVVKSANDQLIADGALDDDTLTALQEQYGDQIDWDDFVSDSVIDKLATLRDIQNEQVQALKQQHDAYVDMTAATEEQKKADEERIEVLKTQIQSAQNAIEGLQQASAPYEAIQAKKQELEALETELTALSNNTYDLNFDINIDETLMDQFVLKVDSIVTEADALRTAAELIGESFIVAAEDAQKLADVYPELMANATIYEDGRVQLDEAAVKAILGNESAVLGADSDTVKGQLNNKIALLDAEIKFYETKKDLLQQALNGDITYTELQEKLNQAAGEFQVETSEWAANEGIQACETSVNEELLALDALDARIAEISQHYSAMLSGEVVEASSGSNHISANLYRKSTREGSGAKTAEDYAALLQAQLDNTNDTLDTLYGERADLTALIANLNSSVDSATTSMGNAINGLGGKYEEKSGKSKESKQEKFKDIDEERERYHQIKETLEDINRELERTEKRKDRAFGAGKIANLKTEIAQLQANTKALQEYQKQIQSYYQSDLAKANGYGWSFDGNGNVTNYEANLQAITSEYNAAVAAYNAMDADSQGNSTILKDAEEKYKNAIDALKQFEETADLMEDVKDQILENARKIADAQLEAIEVEVNLNLKVDDMREKYLKELFDNMGDSADHAADRIENLEKQVDNTFRKIADTKDGLDKTFDLLGQYNGNIDSGMTDRLLNGTASEGDMNEIAKAIANSDGVLDYDKLMSNVEEYSDQLIEYNGQLRELRDSTYEQLSNAIDSYVEEFDKLDKKIGHSAKMIQSYKDLVTAIGKKNVDPSGQLTAQLNQNLLRTSESSYSSAQSRVDAMKKAQADAEEGLRIARATGVEADIQKWTEILEKTTDDLYSAEEDAMDKMNEWIDALGQALEDEIDQVIQNLNDALGGLSNIRDSFDMARELDAQYLQDYQKIYELSKLNRQVTMSIDETDNVAAKQQLAEFQEKILQYQQEGVKMSQYEVDNLQRQYDLELAKIALDEAKAAKNQVRMTRDSEGNYGYVYTADPNAVNNAEQNYEDKLYAMQNANNEYINELQDNIITMQEEMSAKLEELAKDDSLSYEEKMKKMQEATDYYTERLDFYNAQLKLVLGNNRTLFEEDWQSYSEATGYKISADDQYVDKWEETTLAIITGVETQEEYMDRVTQAVQKASEECQNAIKQYGATVDMITAEVVQDAGEQSEALAQTAEDAADDARQLEEDYENTLGQAMNATQSFTDQYAAKIDSSIRKNNEYINSINQVMEKLRELAAQEAATSASLSDPGNLIGSPTSPGTTPGSQDPTQGNVRPAYGYTVVSGDTLIGITAAKRTNSGSSWQALYAANQSVIDNEARRRGMDPGGHWIFPGTQLTIPAGFDTGGYTGDWGTSDGKLAMLHQKELVLNDADTSNMLDIVSMVREISNAIDVNALSTLMSSGLTAASVKANENGKLEQQVTITAEFPNATDKDSILDAFDNVINLAAQYANRK